MGLFLLYACCSVVHAKFVECDGFWPSGGTEISVS